MQEKFIRALACVAIVLTLSLLGFGQKGEDQNASKANTGGAQSSSANSGSAQTSSASSSTGKLSASDRQFLDKAAQGGIAEVELGQLAQQKSQDPKVKAFGERMVTDHSKANDQLKSLAQSKGMTLPTQPNAKDKAEKDRLSKLSGEQFDKAYMNYMVKDHTKDVSEFRKESQSAKDSDVKSFASSTLPTLESHLQEAKQIAPKERAEAKSSKSKGGNTSTSASNPPQL